MSEPSSLLNIASAPSNDSTHQTRALIPLKRLHDQEPNSDDDEHHAPKFRAVAVAAQSDMQRVHSLELEVANLQQNLKILYTLDDIKFLEWLASGAQTRVDKGQSMFQRCFPKFLSSIPFSTQNERDKLQININKIKSERDEARANLKMMKENTPGAHAIGEKVRLEKENKRLAQETAAALSETESLKTKHEELEETHRATIAILDVLQKDAEAFKLKNQRFEVRLMLLIHEEVIRVESGDMKQDNEELRSAQESIRSDLMEAESAATDWRAEYQVLTDQYRVATAALETLETDGPALKTEKEGLERTLEEFRSANVNLSQQLNDAEEKASEWRSRFGRVSDEHIRDSAIIAALQKDKDALQAEKEQFQALQADGMTIRSEKEELERNLRECQNTNDVLTQQVREVDAKATEWQSHYESAVEERDSLLAETERLEGIRRVAVASLQTLQTDGTTLRAEKEDLEVS
ncbi:hypothetical protein EV360DRAFT_90493 [Lentinula raphanica]|nr:hypothetical protein EV360DRAFT_90493 [Lentinula raphanica]